ncbi:hypothetical protein B0I35DRAFT_443645 [Stachybotrys elegans]|uniref:Only prolin and serin are matching in the corresponding protein n=1 Tax=Stachybotrys elegans TaxID=80388 RepID=A0A8K0SGV2_9HYPO|nr:hypothetical protein B0I35DRAFT_443645 [Stachybotrys elegans]
MSPKLKPLLLPQIVENRKRHESLASQTSSSSANEHDMASVYYTTNSSSSDITSPVTPTFSARGHLRYSSSTSSLDLPPLVQDMPSSPIQPTCSKTGPRQLPDVQEHPMERDDLNGTTPQANYFALYSCLCDQPCEHNNSTDSVFPSVSDYEFDYDIGCLSDNDSQSHKKKRSGSDLPFLGLTTRFGSRFNGMNRWRASRKPSLMSSPTTEVSHETVLSRDSAITSPYRTLVDRPSDTAYPPTPAMSCHASTESICDYDADEFEYDDHRASLERDRAMATTPLLPPLMTDHFPRPSLATQPSISSLRHVPSSIDLPLSLPGMQEYDEWSDRLGHANFTITPQPYELDTVNAETVAKFCQDWDAARINYTKHIVRTGENYGHTSNIYALTEAKWAETEGRWKTIYESLIGQTMASQGITSPTAGGSRSRSRGRGRGRSSSSSTGAMRRNTNDDMLAHLEWRRLDSGASPSAVPRMIEALDAGGKFPERGDEDIVGPMQRDEVMIRSESEERKTSRFWKTLVGKVGMRR